MPRQAVVGTSRRDEAASTPDRRRRCGQERKPRGITASRLPPFVDTGCRGGGGGRDNHCRSAHRAASETIAALGQHAPRRRRETRPGGCHRCQSTGCRWRKTGAYAQNAVNSSVNSSPSGDKLPQTPRDVWGNSEARQAPRTRGARLAHAARALWPESPPTYTRHRWMPPA